MRTLSFVVLSMIWSGCSSVPSVEQRPRLPGSGKADNGASTLLLGSTSYCPDAAPYDAFDKLTYTRARGAYQALSFSASEGDQPDIFLGATDPTPQEHPRAWLEDDAGNVIIANTNDDDTTSFDLDTPSLQHGGLYYLIFDNKLDEDATFAVRIDCTQGACAVTHGCGVTLPLAQ